jgi:hypothetical protein
MIRGRMDCGYCKGTGYVWQDEEAKAVNKSATFPAETQA